MLKQYLEGSALWMGLQSAGRWMAQKWKESQIGWMFIRNENDVKTLNSTSYALLSAPLARQATNGSTHRWAEDMRQSTLVQAASHFEYGVFATLFLAPFIPTMACVVLVMLTFLSFWLHRLLKGGPPIAMTSIGFLFVSLILLFGVFAATSLTMVPSLRIFLIYAPFIAFPFLVVQAADSKKRLQTMLFLFLTSGLLVSLYGIYQQFFGDNVGHAWLDDEMFTEISVRVYSTLGNPNVLGEYLLLIIPLAAAMVWGGKKWIAKIYYLGILGCAALCMIFTQSRGCWLGLILAVAVFALLADRRLVLAGIVGLCILPFVLPHSIIDRFMSIGDVSDSSTSYRVYIWLGTINMLRDFWPFGIGLGSDAYNKIYPFYSYSSIIAPHAHNLYLQLLCETGVVGLGTFLATMLVTCKKILLGWMARPVSLYGYLCAAVIAGLLGFLLQGMFDYVWYNYRVLLIFWAFIGFGLAAKGAAMSGARDVWEEGDTA